MLSIFMKKLTVNEAKNKVTTSDNAVLIELPSQRRLCARTCSRCHQFSNRKITEERVAAGFRTKQPDVYYRKLLPQTKRCHEEI